MDNGVEVAAKSMEESEMVFTTASTTSYKHKKIKKHRSLRYKFFKWLVPIILPGHHISENPPIRKERE